MRPSVFKANVILFLLMSSCSTLNPGGSNDHTNTQDRYSAQSWLVVIRSAMSGEKIEEIEIHGLLGARAITAGTEVIRPLGEGAFEVDLSQIAERSTQQGTPEVASLIRNRGVKRIVFDRVGDAAIRARLDGDPESAFILNREQVRAPAGFSERDPTLFERYSPARF